MDEQDLEQKKFDDMSIEELEAEIDGLKDNLEDLESTLNFFLNNTSTHINEGAVNEHQDEMQKLKKEIVRIEKLINES